jgi:hypothetical protein
LLCRKTGLKTRHAPVLFARDLPGLAEQPTPRAI